MTLCATGQYTTPGVSDFKSFFDRDFPYSSQGVNATAQASINLDGQIIAINPVDLGKGYTGIASVIITDGNDGPGNGAAASSVYSPSNGGQIIRYTVTAPGIAYKSPVVTVKAGGIDDTNMNYVRDVDITNAMTMALKNFNQANFPDQDTYNIGVLLKTAHMLCLRLRAASQGARGRGGEWIRTAFNVSELGASFDFPDKIKRSAILAPFMETTYGCQYLQLISPNLVANVRSVIGHTKP